MNVANKLAPLPKLSGCTFSKKCLSSIPIPINIKTSGIPVFLNNNSAKYPMIIIPDIIANIVNGSIILSFIFIYIINFTN